VAPPKASEAEKKPVSSDRERGERIIAELRAKKERERLQLLQKEKELDEQLRKERERKEQLMQKVVCIILEGFLMIGSIGT
jgi:hypothetical protein